MSVWRLIDLRPKRSYRGSGPSVSESMLGRGGLGRLATGSGTARMADANTSSRWKRGMSNPLSRTATRVAYGASQLPRIAWYVGHGLIMIAIAALFALSSRAPRSLQSGCADYVPNNPR
jgi:hypothetical protein